MDRFAFPTVHTSNQSPHQYEPYVVVPLPWSAEFGKRINHCLVQEAIKPIGSFLGAALLAERQLTPTKPDVLLGSIQSITVTVAHTLQCELRLFFSTRLQTGI